MTCVYGRAWHTAYCFIYAFRYVREEQVFDVVVIVGALCGQGHYERYFERVCDEVLQWSSDIAEQYQDAENDNVECRTGIERPFECFCELGYPSVMNSSRR